MLSDAMGVHPSQIGEAVAKSKAAGVPIQFAQDGRAIFTSAQHRKNYCERFSYYDRNGGYSDPAPRHRTARPKMVRGHPDGR